MTQDDIIRMAQEAGFPLAWISDSDGGVLCWKDIKAFAALVAAAEREACAQVVEQTSWSNWFQSDAATAIQARGQE
jgi:hypothetical protein